MRNKKNNLFIVLFFFSDFYFSKERTKYTNYQRSDSSYINMCEIIRLDKKKKKTKTKILARRVFHCDHAKYLNNNRHLYK